MLANELLELTKRVCKQKAETQTLELKSAHVDCPKRRVNPKFRVNTI